MLIESLKCLFIVLYAYWLNKTANNGSELKKKFKLQTLHPQTVLNKVNSYATCQPASRLSPFTMWFSYTKLVSNRYHASMHQANSLTWGTFLNVAHIPTELELEVMIQWLENEWCTVWAAFLGGRPFRLSFSIEAHSCGIVDGHSITKWAPLLILSIQSYT